jgi:hypothetical protein
VHELRPVPSVHYVELRAGRAGHRGMARIGGD